MNDPQLHGDSHLAEVAQKHWSDRPPATKVKSEVVKTELWDYLEKQNFDSACLHTLESSQCLELYLWSSFNDDASHFHALLLVLLLNAKRRENLPNWTLLVNRPAELAVFFRRIRALVLDTDLSLTIRTQVLTCLIGAFQALDVGLIRKECAPLVTISVWHHLHADAARTKLLEENSQFKKAWRAATKRHDAADDESKTRLRFERSWLYNLLVAFLRTLYTPQKQDADALLYCERFMEFMTDLQGQFPTRRYVNTLLKDLNLLVAIKLSPLYSHPDAGLLHDFWALLNHFTHFPIDDHTGRQRSLKDTADLHTAHVARLQRTALRHFREKLNLLALTNYGAISQRSELTSHLENLSDEELKSLLDLLGYRTTYPSSAGLQPDREFLLETLVFSYEQRPTFQELVKNMPILPTEAVLYDPAFLRNEVYDGLRPIAVPKLNLQYLATSDFLWRSFILGRCEAFYEIRSYLRDTVRKMQPKERGRAQGSRMALNIQKPAVVHVVPARVGENIPAEVRAEIILDVSRLPDNIRQEWDELRPEDVVFLLSVKKPSEHQQLTNGHASSGSALDEAPFTTLRSAEVLQVLDEKSRPLRYAEQDGGFGKRPRQRRLLVKLDASAYARDVARKESGKPDIYESINMIVRRKARENNFKPVLESIRGLALSDVPLPPWLQDVFLGMGDPSSASYKNLVSALAALDFRDTFLDWQHVCESFSGKDVHAEVSTDELAKPPYYVEFPSSGAEEARPGGAKKSRKDETGASQGTGAKDSAQNEQKSQESGEKKGKASKKRRREDVESEESVETVKVSTYKPPNQGPYPTDKPPLNQVRFTPVQVEAITSGTQPGLTVIVGPPGTGKTDVATQIINNIYHNFPSERILLVAHSNQALNQLFQKIASLDIDQRHLLRLGQGERDLQLESEASYGRQGRVEHFLERGAQLLSSVNLLASSMKIPGAHGNSCETASYFNTVHVQPKWKAYLDKATASEDVKEIVQSFPFLDFFASAPQPLFPDDVTKEKALDIISGCRRHIEKMFVELEDIRPFEVLRRDRERSNYLLVKEARIIAMTSTHAAIRRQEIVKLGFQYDSVIMEEAAQVTEIGNFTPLALQKSAVEGEAGRLKRVVLCGDHLQNSPIIQNHALRQYANLDQSLFQRLIRLGVPHIQLDAQGRARASLASLYAFRYPSLRNLPHVENAREFVRANAGLRWDYQFVDVPDYKGRGETQPTAHFVQNLGEAEYVVAMYMYMRLLGYPARSITILTTYAGQRALIRDVLGHRCAKNRLFGLPRSVATVDKYQGEQNDYVLLSLVRTRSPGYLRDVRRLTVALSRARLGLYVFGRRAVFESSAEVAPAFARLLERPDKLQLVVDEMFPAERRADADVEATDMEGVEHLGQYVFEMTKAKAQAIRDGGGKLPEAEQGVGVDDDEDDQPPGEVDAAPGADEDEDEDEDADGAPA